MRSITFRKDLWIDLVLWVLFLLCLAFTVCCSVFAQNPNPQTDFATAERLIGPSMELNYNDLTSSFKEVVSGVGFSSNESQGYLPFPNSAPYVASFDGSTDSATGTSALTSNSIFSYVGWAYISTNSQSGTLITDNPTGVAGGVALFVGSATGTPGTGNYLNVIEPGVAWMQTGATIGTGWHCIAVTRDGTTMRAYIDGTQTPTLANSTATPSAPAGPIYIGAQGSGNNNLPDMFSTWEISTAAATQAQVQSFCTSNTDIPSIVGKWKFNEGTGATALDSSTNTNNLTISGTKYGNTGYYMNPTPTAVSTRQPGFDSSNPGNTSAEFPYNGYAVAPNNNLASVEWDSPYSILVHIDRLQWDRTGTLVLASKGDTSGSTNFWELYLQMTGNYSQVCFQRIGGGPASSGGQPNTQSTTCTNNGVDIAPNGFNYDIVVTDNGSGSQGNTNGATGEATNAISIYVNGLGPGQLPGQTITASNNQGFGYVTVALSGTMAGYTGNATFSNNGTGGPNCNVSGVLVLSGSVLTVNNPFSNGYYAYGCTSVPTLTISGGGGTGAVLTATLAGASMVSASPLMAPGYINGGVYYGPGGTDTAKGNTYVDEAAVFPGVLTATQIGELFYHTKFYQGLMKSYTTPPLVIVSEDGCNDTDNDFALDMLIRAHQLGEINLIGVESTNGEGPDLGYYRQLLDNAGLGNVPLASASTTPFSATASCSATAVSNHNADTPQTTSAYETSVTMYRTLFAKYPTTPINIMNGAAVEGITAFMQSPADSISSLTGAQLWAQNASNGGVFYGQGLGENDSFGNYYDATSSQYFFTNAPPMVQQWYGGTPQNGGPGALGTRTQYDPLWQRFSANGSDLRTCYDCLPAAGIISTIFSGGVNVALSGSGTGYADLTPFTSSGGGANCTVTGYMVSSSGVPASIEDSGGNALNTTYGIGSGCTTASSPPTLNLVGATGTGETLTATTLTSVCSEITQTAAGNGATSSAACAQAYFFPFTGVAFSGSSATPLFQWFVNSLVDQPQNRKPRN